MWRGCYSFHADDFLPNEDAVDLDAVTRIERLKHNEPPLRGSICCLDSNELQFQGCT